MSPSPLFRRLSPAVVAMLVVAGLGVGCGKRIGAPEAVPAPKALEMARERPVPNPLRGRFQIKLRSDALDLAGSTGGAVIIDRPGRGHLAVLGPLGQPLVTLHSDGVGMSATLTGERRHLVALDADKVLAEATGGVAGTDDLIALLVGDLPFDDSDVLGQQIIDDRLVEVVLEGPQKTSVIARLDREWGTPALLEARDQEGQLLISATYGAFEDIDEVGLLPTQVDVVVPMVELTVRLKYKSWKLLSEDPKDSVFSIDAPKGMQPESMEHAVKKLAERVVEDVRAAEEAASKPLELPGVELPSLPEPAPEEPATPSAEAGAAPAVETEL